MTNIFFDVETIDFPEKIQGDGTIQLGVVLNSPTNNNTFCELCNPGKPISYNAMATHHITPDKIIGLEPVTSTRGFQLLKYFHTVKIPDTYFFVYNMDCDIVMMQRVGLDLTTSNVIDVFRLARFINDKTNLQWESNGLQYMMYATGAYKLRAADQTHAHDALADSLDLKYLWEFLSGAYKITPEMAMQITHNPIFYTYVPYGTHRGKKFVDLEPGQLRYMLGNSKDKDILFTLQKIGLN